MRLKDFFMKSIFNKLLLYSLCISLIPLIVISVIQYGRIYEKLENEVNDSHKQVISQYMQSVNEKLDMLQFQLSQISNSTIVQDMLVDKELTPLERGVNISTEVSNILALEQNSAVRSCIIYSMREDTLAYGKNVTMMPLGKMEKWYQIIGELEEENYTYQIYNEPVLTLVGKINYLDTSRLRTELLGVVKLDIKIDKLLVKTQALDNVKICIYDASDSLLYQSEAVEESEDYIVYEEFIERYDLKIEFLFEKGAFDDIKKENLKITFLLLLILIVFSVVISSVYSRHFTGRISFLLQKIKRVEEGDLTEQPSLKGNDEIAMLDIEVRNMTRRLNQLIEKNYVQKLENKNTELQNLRLQINPHFLYNTLETISSIAAVKNVFVICDICECLGEILRYSLGKRYGEFVSVEQEMYHTKNYIYIQQVRFEDRFDVVYSLDERLMDKKIPRFILQPIVENAIIHGVIEKKEKGTLEISLCEKLGGLVISVKDDGRGMSQDELENLKEMIEGTFGEVKTSDSIGVRNVNQRIKMICGSQYGITVSSALNQGSCFELLLPLR